MAAETSTLRTRPRVLIVEDDELLREALVASLGRIGCDVLALADGTALSDEIDGFDPDLIGLDVYLPAGPDGFELARQVRARATTPLVFLTAADSQDQRLLGFRVGGDDYIVKPFPMAEFLARVRAVLQRSGRSHFAVKEVRDILIDEANRTAIRADAALNLSDTEFDILCILARSPGTVYSKEQLLSEVWGLGVADPRLVEARVTSLRRKLEARGPRLIFTEWGRGYVIRL